MGWPGDAKVQRTIRQLSSENGLGLTDVGRAVGVSYSVRKVLMEDLREEELEAYRAKRIEVMDGLSMKAAESLDRLLSEPALGEQMTMRLGAGVFEKLPNMSRLERGQPTEIRAVADIRVEFNALLGDLLKRFEASNFEEVAKGLGEGVGGE